MPAITPGSLILVTGASGFLGAHTVQQFLDQGYPVRGTVRSKAKGEYLVNLFKGSKVPFEYAVVEDIGKPGAFDEAVKGVMGIAHTASPFHFNGKDVQKDFIEPAVNGTVGVLQSAKKYNPNVARIVITSSVAAIFDTAKPNGHYTSKDWNLTSPAVLEEKGNETDALNQYCASKTLAERAFWKYIEDEKPSFDGVAINPVMIYGPVIQEVSGPSSLNTSVGWVYHTLQGNQTYEQLESQSPMCAIDVRDVALAHVRALDTPSAGGQRYITSNGVVSMLHLARVLEKLYPEVKTFPHGVTAEQAAASDNTAITYDGSPAEELLGRKYISVEQMVKDTVQGFVDRLGLAL